MSNMIFAFIVILLAVAGAELVRITCKRALLTPPVQLQRVPVVGAAELE